MTLKLNLKRFQKRFNMKDFINMVIDGIIQIRKPPGKKPVLKDMLKELEGLSDEQIEAKIKELDRIGKGMIIGTCIIIILITATTILAAKNYNLIAMGVGILTMSLYLFPQLYKIK